VVKAKQKPLEEIKEAIKDYKQVLNIGCGGCVSVCLAGGQKEVNILNAELNMSFKKDSISCRVEGHTVERQCSPEFLEGLKEIARSYDCLLSMACGAGVQLIAEILDDKPVLPAVNTMAVGIDREIGWYEEKCRACGECVLGYTGAICPVTRCAKSIFNGPCGGTDNGKCEVDKEVPCAWNDIFERLKKQDRLDNILKIRPPMAWKDQVQRTIIQPAYEGRYQK
jgi:ferredoxin